MLRLNLKIRPYENFSLHTFQDTTIKMKKLLFIILFLSLAQFAICQIKPLHTDTIVCIVDTTNCFTNYKENPFEKNPNFHWLISIKGHYYDHKSLEDADFASIVFSADFRNSSVCKDSLIISVPICKLEERFTVITDIWLNEQKSLYSMQRLVGFAPWINYNFVIFKNNIESSTDGKVVMHRVLVGYSEIQD